MLCISRMNILSSKTKIEPDHRVGYNIESIINVHIHVDKTWAHWGPNRAIYQSAHDTAHPTPPTQAKNEGKQVRISLCV